MRGSMADARTADVAPIMREVAPTGASLRAIAAELSARGIPSPRGTEWTAMGVKRALARDAARP